MSFENKNVISFPDGMYLPEEGLKDPLFDYGTSEELLAHDCEFMSIRHPEGGHLYEPWRSREMERQATLNLVAQVVKGTLATVAAILVFLGLWVWCVIFFVLGGG